MNQRLCIYESLGINNGSVGIAFPLTTNKVRSTSGIAKIICERVYDLSGKDKGDSMIPKKRASTMIYRGEVYNFHEDPNTGLSMDAHFLPDEEIIQETLEQYEVERQQKKEQEYFRQYSQAFGVLLRQVFGYRHIFAPDPRTPTIMGALRGFFETHGHLESLDARDDLLSTFLLVFARRFANGSLPESKARALIRLFDVGERYDEIKILSGGKPRPQSGKKAKR